jgi:hypothetical protein
MDCDSVNLDLTPEIPAALDKARLLAGFVVFGLNIYVLLSHRLHG